MHTLKLLYFAKCLSKITTLVGNIEKELESVRATFVKHLHSRHIMHIIVFFQTPPKKPKSLNKNLK
jgi:hypothetical protein